MRPERVLSVITPNTWRRIYARRVFANSTERARVGDVQLSASQRLGVVPQAALMEAEEQKYMLALSGTESFKHVEVDDFVISLRSFEGGFEHSPFAGCVSPAYTVLRPKAIVDSGYFRHLFKSAIFRQMLAAFNVGVRDGKSIRYDDFSEFSLALPSLDEQRRIAAFLDRETARIDALIEKKTRFIELLREKQQADINAAVTRGLALNVPMLDTGDPWLGKIPAHWTSRPISLLSRKITNGFVGPTRDVLVDDGVRYLQSLHIKGFGIRFETPYFVTEQWSQAHAKSILKVGDVLIVQTGDLGQVAVVTPEFAGCNCHALIIVSPIEELVTGKWLGRVLHSRYGYNSLLSVQTGALHPHLNCGEIRNIAIPLPPLLEQDQIERVLQAKISKTDTLVQATERSIRLLRERRAALITAAVTGQIDVLAEAPIEETEPA